MKSSDNTVTRRDFLKTLISVMATAAGALFFWPFIKSMNPAKDVMANASIDVDISDLEIGKSKTVMWRGKPVFIKRRTKKEIKEATQVKLADLKHRETDGVRVINPEYLVIVGICTHLGCIPSGQKMTDNKGDFNGWLCPCHGSHYDSSGRIRKGPAPTNLTVPNYKFIDDKTIKIG